MTEQEDGRIKLTYTRLFSTGNFEHMKIGLELDSTKDTLGKDFQQLVATTIALKESGLDLERKFTYERDARNRIAALKAELEGLQATLPAPEDAPT